MAKHPFLGILALILALPILSLAHPRQMEALDRGLVVANAGKSGMLVSWRLLGSESSDMEFNLYRDGTKIASIGKTAGTNYLDKDGKVTSKYTVAAVVGGKEGAKSAPSLVLDSTIVDHGKSFPYKVLKLDRPASQTMPDSAKTVCNYYPDDMSVGDLDGDGEYELVVKWIPDNYKDNSQSMEGSYTGTVFIDAYELDGTKLWRIDLGKNIRAGAHYTQFQVYDYDGDGKAEMVVKTGDGTIDGKGKVIGDATKDHRNKSGIIITGPEYLTVFRGSDGAEITTIDYVPSRDIRKLDRYDSLGLNWGDNYGNRCDRFLAATAYLDGVHPSLITARGYYTAAYVVAYDFDGKNLKQRWFHKSETPGKGLYGQGNLNIVVGDLDRDGKDEIVYGAAALNSDGTVRYSTGLGYGYAAYVGDFDPDHAGLEVWAIHSDYDDAKYIDELLDDKGNIIFGDVPTKQKEDGRAMVADIDSTSRGYEMWSYIVNEIHSAKGTPIKLDSSLIPDGEEFNYLGSLVPTIFRIYFDGDLQDELLDGPVISKFNSGKRTLETYFQGDSSLGLIGNQGVKYYPCLVADLFGDWREEMIFRSERDSSKIYILSTPVTTPHRLYTLMHDSQYRQAIAWQNTAYNLPPHTSYYLPDMVKKLTKPNLYTVGENEYVVPPDAVLEKIGTVSEKQTVSLGKAISDISYSFMFCTGVKAEGLPAGVSAKVDSAASTVKISGKPTKVGTFKFSLTTVGSKAKNVSLNGEIIVKDTVTVPPKDTTKVDTTKTDTTKVDTTKTTPKDTSKVDTTKTTPKDTSKVDTTKTTPKDTSKVDTTKTTPKDTTKTDTTKVDSTKRGTSVVDASKPAKGKGEIDTSEDGYIGDGFYDFVNSNTSYATWNISSKKKSLATMSIRYSNGDSISRDMILVFNDKEIGTVKMGVTGGWAIWEMTDMELIELKEGKNTITLKSTVKNGGPDVDAFFFDIGGVEAIVEKTSLPVARVNEKFFYRPSTGSLFTSVPGFVEILFYDVSGTVRGSVSGHVKSGESVLALDDGMLSEGMYFVKVKLNGKLMQKGMYKW